MLGRTITFAPGVVPESEEDEIDEVLQRLPPRVWASGAAIYVAERFSGGGGAVVLRIDVGSGSPPLSEVVKVGPAAEMKTELDAWTDTVRPIATRMCTPIRHSTLDPGSAVSRNGREAIVYGDAKHFAGAREGTVTTTLEDVFTAASLGDRAAAERAGAAIGDLFEQARGSLYRDAVTGPPTSLRDMLPTLGPDLTIRVAQAVDATKTTRLTERTIWKAGSTPPAADRLTNSFVRIDDVIPERRRDRLLGRVGCATVELLDMPADPTGAVAVRGTVVETRPHRVMSRLGRILPGLAEDGDTVRMGDTHALHPFTALRKALEAALPRVQGTCVHGDLNSRNVLLVGADPYLIDYARTKAPDAGGSLVADLAWLEINLMRAIGGDPTLADLVSLQRLVTAGAALLPASGIVVTAAIPGLSLIAGVLLRVREQAYRCCPGDRAHWLTDYSRHLVLAAHRTFKWLDDRPERTPAAASVATAAVAGEWIDAPAAFRHWSDPELRAAITMAGDAAHQAPAAAARLLGALTREVDRGGRTGLEDVLAESANTVAAAVYRPRGGPGPEPFMELSVATGDELPRPAIEVLTGSPAAVLLGAPGTGKSTVVRELARRLEAVAANRDTVRDPGRHRLPVLIPAADLRAFETDAVDVLTRNAPMVDEVAIEDLMDVGCVHLVVDGGAAVGVLELRDRHPRTPVLMTARSAEGVGAQFTTYEIRPPAPDQAIRFLAAAAIRRGVPMTALHNVLAGRGTPRIDELFTTAAGVALLARHLRPQVRPSLTDLLDEAFAGEESLRAAEILAAHLVEGAITSCSATAAEALFETDPAGWRQARDGLLDRAVLESHAGELCFARPVYRDYFAARFAIRDTAGLPARTLRMAWREPLRLAAGQRDAGEAAATMIGLARATDPPFAARLLAMRDPDDASFIAEQLTRLRDPRAAGFERQVAAEALHHLGEPGVTALCAVARDDRLSPAARAAAIRPLVDRPPTAGEEPVRLAAHLLAEVPQPARLRTAAVQLAARHDAVTLAAVIAEHCEANAPWHYHLAAQDALRRLRVTVPGRVRRAYLVAARRRLDRLTAVLPRLTTQATYTAAQREREHLLVSVLNGDREVLLAHREDFEIGGYAVDRLDRLPGDAAPPVTALPSDQPGRTAAILSLAGRDSRTARENERLARLLTVTRQVDPVAGARLAERVYSVLADGDSPDRLRWPLRVALALCSPDAPTVQELLRSPDPEDSATALAALGSAAFLVDAAPPPEHSWPVAVVDGLRALRPSAESGWAAVTYVRAAAAAGLPDGLDLACDLLARPELDEMTRTVAHPVYGVLTLTARGEVLAAAGYLARPFPGGPATTVAGHLRDSGLVGGLIGSAFLGDTAAVLRGLDGAEPRVHAAARNAALHWDTDRDQARDAVAARLREGGYDRRARSTLGCLLRELSVKIGRLTAPGG